MLKNYVTTALRHLWRRKLYTGINILGLAIGLAVYLFSQIFVDYEQSYDTFFPNHERIYAVTIDFDPSANVGLQSAEGVHTAIGPLLTTEVPSVETWARLLQRQYLVRTGNTPFYQIMRFADPAFLDIFKIDIINGNATSPIAGPTDVMLSESTAEKYFGDQNPIGQTITINNLYDFQVTAVFRDLPVNSHLTQNLAFDTSFEMVANTQALSNLSSWDTAGDFNSISFQDKTYVLLPEGGNPEAVVEELVNIYQKHMPDRLKDFVAAYGITSLRSLNNFLFEATGLPVISSVLILGMLILLVACLNYTNLATAQIMGRTREVGMRRTLGASKKQLFSQFLVESTLLTLIALLLALSLIDLALPFIRNITGKEISLNYLSDLGSLSWLIMIAALVGLLAGGYPAYLISHGKTTQMLNGTIQQGKTGSKIRTIMLVVQFVISIFMMIAVVIIYSQNKKLEESSRVFAKDQIVNISNIQRPEIAERRDILKAELERIPGVERVAYSTVVPFEQNNINSDYMLQPGDESTKTMFWRLSGDEDFIPIYEFSLLEGRLLDQDRIRDGMLFDDDGKLTTDVINVVVNELLTTKLGVASLADALGVNFYQTMDDGSSRQFQIVGVVTDKNFMGLFNDIKPTYFVYRPDNFRIASVKVSAINMEATLAAIDETWIRINPEYPIQRQMLEDEFRGIYRIFEGINAALAGFATLALLVAIIGLFGLAAFMAQKRTKEIGLRKALGANVSAIVRLLVWQFSRPVVIAILLASPLGYLAAGFYLDFFAERVEVSPMLFILTGIIALIVSALTVSFHAVKAARANPINALRYE